MKKSVEHGYGYLSREVNELSDLDEVPGARPFIGEFKSAAENIDKELEIRSLPIAHKYIVRIRDEEWVYRSTKTKEEWEAWRKEYGIRIQLGMTFIQEREELYSENWVLAELSLRYYMALKYLLNGEQNKIAEAFYVVGKLHAQLGANLKYGQDVLKHRNQRRAAGKLGENTKEIIELITAYVEVDLLSVTKSAQKVFEVDGLGSSAGANRKLFYDHQKRNITL